MKEFTDPTPKMEPSFVDARGNLMGTCATCIPIKILRKDVVILEEGTKCGWAGRLSAKHAMCMPILLAKFSRCLYDLCGTDGFTIKTKDGPDGSYQYVELQLDDVDWAK